MLSCYLSSNDICRLCCQLAHLRSALSSCVELTLLASVRLSLSKPTLALASSRACLRHLAAAQVVRSRLASLQQLGRSRARANPIKPTQRHKHVTDQYARSHDQTKKLYTAHDVHDAPRDGDGALQASRGSIQGGWDFVAKHLLRRRERVVPHAQRRERAAEQQPARKQPARERVAEQPRRLWNQRGHRRRGSGAVQGDKPRQPTQAV